MSPGLYSRIMDKQTKKNLTLFAVMALSLAILIIVVMAGSLDSLLMTPETTPEEWLADHPHLSLFGGPDEGGFIFAKPTSSFFVYLLAVVTLWAGLGFLGLKRTVDTSPGTPGPEEKSRREGAYWWGMGLVIWALGTIFAGTSYQAFAYEIKCAGQELCLWTSGWEILYLFCEVAAINALLAGTVWASGRGKARTLLLGYALLNTMAYLMILSVGTLQGEAFPISFEFMLFFSFPSLLGAFTVNMVRYRREKSPKDKAMIQVWIGLALVTVLYYGYYLSGIEKVLWEGGLWFSANDVLHIALIIWMVFIRKRLAPLLQKRVEG